MQHDAILGAVDRALMVSYDQAQSSLRRIVRLVATVLPMMILLVGSCKTSDLPAAYGGNSGAEQFRIALFPDRVDNGGEGYYPAAGYVSRARKFVFGAPESLMRLTAQEVTYLFGKPTMERKDADARIWQYKTDTCVVDFYFYGDNAPVAHVDYRGGDDAGGCLKEISL